MTCPGEIQLALASPHSLTFRPIFRALEGALADPGMAGLVGNLCRKPDLRGMETCPRWRTRENTPSLLEARVSHRGLLAPAEPEATGSASFSSAPFRPTGKTSLLLNAEKTPRNKGLFVPLPHHARKKERLSLRSHSQSESHHLITMRRKLQNEWADRDKGLP